MKFDEKSIIGILIFNEKITKYSKTQLIYTRSNEKQLGQLLWDVLFMKQLLKMLVNTVFRVARLLRDEKIGKIDEKMGLVDEKKKEKE